MIQTINKNHPGEQKLSNLSEGWKHASVSVHKVTDYVFKTMHQQAY